MDYLLFLAIPTRGQAPGIVDFNQIRARDGRRVLHGAINYETPASQWMEFRRCPHISTGLDQKSVNNGFQGLITHNYPPGTNSLQNEILTESMHRFWDDYSISVNPYNGFKIQTFQPNAWPYPRNILDSAFRQPDDPIGVIPTLLRWHYKQAVLCNMQGTGEHSF